MLQGLKGIKVAPSSVMQLNTFLEINVRLDDYYVENKNYCKIKNYSYRYRIILLTLSICTGYSVIRI